MDRMQTFMNEVYDFWNKEGINLSKNEVLEQFPPSRNMAVRFGNFNYQTYNGGTSQWIHNHYMEDDIEALIAFCEEGVSYGIDGFRPLLEAFRQLQEDMVDFEDTTEEDCSQCEGMGEVTYDDIDDVPYVDGEVEEFFETQDEVSLSCEECNGSGTITMNNPYPDSVENLENVLYSMGEDALFAIVEELIDKQLEAEKQGV